MTRRSAGPLRPWARLAWLALIGAGLALGAGAQAADERTVVVGRIEGVINPITAQYVDRVVSGAEARGAHAVVLTIDTPGGLVDSTFKITTRLLNARVPVITFVSPSGARAASAGTFITLAGHVAAMAPATNLGAAHPVDSSGGDIKGDLRDKAENDAVAQITKIAIARGRNAEWAEQAVRKSVSIRDDEALRINVIDLVAADLTDLLSKLDGREVALPQRTLRLMTRGAPLDEDGRTPIENVLHFIVDPQIAVLLFTVGTYGLIFELSNPSLIFPGVVGVIAILLALFAFGALDASSAGIALMTFAVVLFVLEIKVPSHGILSVGGAAALLLGTLLIFPPWRPTFPGLRYTVDPVTVAVVVGVTVGFFALLIRVSRRFLQLPTASGAEVLVGAIGVAKSDLRPSGVVRVADNDWTATSAAGPIAKGMSVRVQRVDSVRLIVEPAEGRETS